MKVLYFSTDYGPHDHRFLSALAKTPHSVNFMRLARLERGPEDRPVPPGIAQVAWAGGRGPFRWRNLPFLLRDFRRVIGEIKPDLIHAGPVQTCAFLAVLSGFRPVLTMSWGFDLMQDADRDTWWRWVTHYTLRRSTFFVSDARVTRDRAVALGMQPDRTAVFAWGVDLRQYRPQKRASPRLSVAPRGMQPRARGARSRKTMPEPFVLLCNRSWEPRYGVDLVAKGFVLAAQKHAGLALILLNAGSQADSIRRILLEGGKIDRVRLVGQVPPAAMPPWYQKADLFVSPSHVDGSSVSLMEALASGMPVLVSDIPANREWVRHDVNGWLFRDGDAEDLANQILSISGQQSAFPRIRRAARRVAEARADWDKNFRVLLHAYKRAVTVA